MNQGGLRTLGYVACPWDSSFTDTSKSKTFNNTLMDRKFGVIMFFMYACMFQFSLVHWVMGTMKVARLLARFIAIVTCASRLTFFLLRVVTLHCDVFPMQTFSRGVSGGSGSVAESR